MKTYHNNGSNNFLLKNEVFFAISLFLAGLILRVIYVFHFCINSDEPQHMHVIWGWTQGLVQYKDFFDNHMPLFHLIFIPVFNLIGEKPDILYFMRFAMFPFYLLTLYFVYLIGRNLYSRYVGLWSAVVLGFFPRFFFKSLEFRSDNMWMACWLFLLAVLSAGKMNFKKAFLAGLLTGILFAISLKTILLIVMLLFSILICSVIVIKKGRKINPDPSNGVLGPAKRINLPSHPHSKPSSFLPNFSTLFVKGMDKLRGFRRRGGINFRKIGGLSLAACGGAVLIPGAIILFFMDKGALDAMFYGVISHNMVYDVGTSISHLKQILFFIILPFVIFGAIFFNRADLNSDIGIKRTILFLLGPLCFFGLLSFWPVFARQDLLPIMPMLALLVVALFFRNHIKTWKILILIILALYEILYIAIHDKVWQDETIHAYNKISEAIKLTKRNEYVMDLKGELIFRPRPFFYVMEHMTKERLDKEIIKDTIPEDIIEKKCYVSVGDNDSLPPRGREFLNENFVFVGNLRVTGQKLGVLTKGQKKFKFEIKIPGPYIIVSSKGAVKGSLDKINYDGPRELSGGHHEFVPDSTEAEYVVVWAPAVQRGFMPRPSNN